MQKGDFIMTDLFFAKDFFEPGTQWSITQAHYREPSHLYQNAVDYCSSFGSDLHAELKAPFPIRALYKSNESNTIFYESVDNIQFADGTVGPLAMSCTHMRDDQLKKVDYYEGKIYNKGDIFYYEGRKGGNNNNKYGKHVHIRFAKGRFKKTGEGGGDLWDYVEKSSPDGYKPRNYEFVSDVCPMIHSDVMYINDFSFNYPYDNNNKIDSSKFNWKTRITKYYLFAERQGFNLRWQVRGNIAGFVPKGSKVLIQTLLSLQSDGYQWARVVYDNKIMYAQIDTKNCQSIRGDSYGRFLFAAYYPFRIRITPVTGLPIVTVPKGSKAEILSFGNIQSDGYQWARVKYNGYVGFSQIDTKQCYLIV